MSGWRCRSGIGPPRRGDRFPESTPPHLNYVTLTGTLLGAPLQATSPRGDAVTLLRLGFPVRDPDFPEDLWTSAKCEVEVTAALARRIPRLRVGAPLLASGRLSDRNFPESLGQHGVILASTVHTGAPWDQRPALHVVGGE
jgi:hypothetical protein